MVSLTTEPVFIIVSIIIYVEGIAYVCMLLLLLLLFKFNNFLIIINLYNIFSKKWKCTKIISSGIFNWRSKVIKQRTLFFNLHVVISKKKLEKMA